MPQGLRVEATRSDQERISVDDLIRQLQTLLQTGTIALFPVSRPSGNIPLNERPVGWLECNGVEYPVDEFRALFNKLRFLAGTPVKDDCFKVPTMTSPATTHRYFIKT